MPKIYSNDIKLIKRKNKFFRHLAVFLLFIVTLATLFFCGLGIAMLITSNSLGNIFSNNKITYNSATYYAVAFGDFEEEEEAKNCAIWTLTVGGAGQLYYENSYKVIGQIYRAMTDANKVLEGINGDLNYEPRVISINVKKIRFSISNLKKQDKKDIINFIKTISNKINEVLEISNQLDKNEISNVMAGSKINSLKSEIKIVSNKLSLINTNYSDSNLNMLQELFLKMEDDLDVTVNKLLSSSNYSSSCKYLACQMLIRYQDFAKNVK